MRFVTTTAPLTKTALLLIVAACSNASPGGSNSGGAPNQGNNSGGTPATAGGANATAGTGAGTPMGGSTGASGSPASGGAGTSGSSGTSGTSSTTGGSSAGGAGNANGGSATGGKGGAGGTNSGGTTSNGGSSGAPGTPGVRIIGRTAPGTTGTRLEWSGTSIAARFNGTQVSAQLTDGNNGNSFEVVIDGGTPRKIFTAAGQTTLQLATGLANGTHNLVFWRDSEATYGVSEFIGLTNFGAGGALLAPPAAPARRIEVVGDSISCGAGIEGGPAGCQTTLTNENHYLSYGAIAARDVGADVVTIAWSGIGVYRNYNDVGPSANTMPARYDFAIPTDTSTSWDFTKYQPHAVIINLTSNDFSVFGDPGAPYITAYVNFVRHIRSKYASARIFCVIEWSTSGPDINQIVSNVQAGGDNNIEAFDIRPFANGNGCAGHPDIAGSKAMGDGLAARLRTALGW